MYSSSTNYDGDRFLHQMVEEGGNWSSVVGVVAAVPVAIAAAAAGIQSWHGSV